MQFLTVFAVLTFIFHITSALPYTAQPFLDLGILPICAQRCTPLLETASRCVPPNAYLGTGNHTAYVDCFCRNEWLRSLNNVGEMCGISCSHEDETLVERYYGSLCGVSSPYWTLSPIVSPTSTPTLPTSSFQAKSTVSVPSTASSTYVATVASATSLTALPPTGTTSSDVEGPSKHVGAPQSWGQKHWKVVVAGVLIPFAVLSVVMALAALYAWYTRVLFRRRQRPMTSEERKRKEDRLMQERLEQMGLIPLQTVTKSTQHRTRFEIDGHVGTISVPAQPPLYCLTRCTVKAGLGPHSDLPGLGQGPAIPAIAAHLSQSYRRSLLVHQPPSFDYHRIT
ncbi:hypothetical protein C7974DRAFT_381275 [Boeremia exigua]|uniref:uncharacterized protein n=1 Tax=Boeremia exigua TaxID=749465 RepID=UPI001E8CFEB2|nr:uncharacterized protein C7974DRAFT_381275 [Boeremia exigua]KAH6612773.1 hypothetical protein C7974DRAFT_381275 [Boeremia exigua]